MHETLQKLLPSFKKYGLNLGSGNNLSRIPLSIKKKIKPLSRTFYFTRKKHLVKCFILYVKYANSNYIGCYSRNTFTVYDNFDQAMKSNIHTYCTLQAHGFMYFLWMSNNGRTIVQKCTWLPTVGPIPTFLPLYHNASG